MHLYCKSCPARSLRNCNVQWSDILHECEWVAHSALTALTPADSACYLPSFASYRLWDVCLTASLHITVRQERKNTSHGIRWNMVRQHNADTNWIIVCDGRALLRHQLWCQLSVKSLTSWCRSKKRKVIPKFSNLRKWPLSVLGHRIVTTVSHQDRNHHGQLKTIPRGLHSTSGELQRKEKRACVGNLN